MKIIFLDFDGVMNNRQWSLDAWDKHNNPYLFDPQNVAALNRITDQTGAKIVISSSWRHGWDLPKLRAHLLEQGVKAEVIDITPTGSLMDHFPEDWGRGHEIDLWLKEHTDGKAVFVILDDDNDMVPHLDRHIHTSMKRGLTMEQAGRAIEMLKGVTW